MKKSTNENVAFFNFHANYILNNEIIVIILFKGKVSI